MKSAYRYYLRSPDGEFIDGFDRLEGAEAAAIDYGEGACIVDTGALSDEPMLRMVKDGKVNSFSLSGWNANQLDASANMIEGIRNGHPAIVHAYIAKGGDVNLRDSEGGTPLHQAACRGVPEIVALLLAHDANPRLADAQGDLPVDVAREYDNAKILELLEKA